MAAASPGPPGQRVQYWWWLTGHVEPRARADTEGDRKDGCRSARTRAERRHAPHLRRYVGRPPRPRLQSAGHTRERPRPAVSVAYEMRTIALFALCPLLSALAGGHCRRLLVQCSRDRRHPEKPIRFCSIAEMRRSRIGRGPGRARISPSCSSPIRRARCAPMRSSASATRSSAKTTARRTCTRRTNIASSWPSIRPIREPTTRRCSSAWCISTRC